MGFIKAGANPSRIVDPVFTVADLAKKAKECYGCEQVIDATIGSLYSEDHQLVAFQSVFSSYDALPSTVKAAYASDFVGNENYLRQVQQWVLDGHCSSLHPHVIATPGGTGAISTAMDVLLDIGETILLPDIAWGSYALMAQTKQLKTMTYPMFAMDRFGLEELLDQCRKLMDEQRKVVVVINDPCHNPTGYSMSKNEWETLIRELNELSKQGPCVILNDIAYIDYAYTGKQARDYLDVLEQMSDNVMTIIAFSCSKSLTSYGLRLGAALVLSKNKEEAQCVQTVMEKVARSTWSNAANAAMENFVQVTTTHKEEFVQEKQYYIDLLYERSQKFLADAKRCQLPLYPYKEGFFITIRCQDNEKRDRFHEELIKHQIFTVKVNRGIRVALCSLSVKQCTNLASRIKQVLDQVMSTSI